MKPFGEAKKAQMCFHDRSTCTTFGFSGQKRYVCSVSGYICHKKTNKANEISPLKFEMERKDPSELIFFSQLTPYTCLHIQVLQASAKLCD